MASRIKEQHPFSNSGGVFVFSRVVMNDGAICVITSNGREAFVAVVSFHLAELLQPIGDVDFIPWSFAVDFAVDDLVWGVVEKKSLFC